MLCREGNGVMIDAVAGTDERPRAVAAADKACSSTDALAMANTVICGLSAAACLAVLAAGLCTGNPLPSFVYHQLSIQGLWSGRYAVIGLSSLAL